MGISDFRDAQFVWVLWTRLLGDNPPHTPIPTFREKRGIMRFTRSIFNKEPKKDKDKHF